MTKRHGFTLIELLVTIGIISAIAGLSLPAYSAMQKNMALNNAAQELTDALRAVRTKSLASDQGLNHGLQLNSNGYTEINTGITHQLPNGLIITIINGPSDIYFQRLLGLSVSGDSKIQIGYTTGQPKTIDVGSNGQIVLH